MARRRLPLLRIFILLSCLILLYFGVPRFMAELMLVPGTPIVERLNRGESVPESELNIAQESREQAVAFVDHPKAYSQLGTVFLTRAHMAIDGVEQKAYASKAIENLEKALSLSQLNTHAWLRLSNARLILGGDENRQKALEAWRQSVETANFEPSLLSIRIHTGITLYDLMTEVDKEILRAQADITFDWHKRRFRTYVRQHQLVEWAVFLLTDADKKAYMSK